MAHIPSTHSIWQRLFPKAQAARRARTRLAVSESENTLLVGARSLDDAPRDRSSYDRAHILEECLDAWRFNPLARRIVELTSQYVVGGGLRVQCEDARTQAFVDAFWNNPLNRMDVRLGEMCDELSRSGNLFVLVSTDGAGMSYLRVVPASQVESIQARPNDIEQPQHFTLIGEDAGGMPLVYPAYDANSDSPGEDGQFAPVMLHYAVNRPAGAQWGESDLAPLLRWLSRYAAWLEDRVRLNRFRNAFLYVVKARFINEAARQARQAVLAANPPTPGSILVSDESEEWSVISPKLEALDASTDGMAVKKMVAAGAGVPLHFLAEPESSTRTTAEAAGGPTYRRYEQRQRYFVWMLKDLLRVVCSRRAAVGGQVLPEAVLEVHTGDISARDNVSLSMAGVNITGVFERLYDMGLIDAAEMLRVVYRFVGESADLEALLRRGSGEDRRAKGSSPLRKPAGSQPVFDPDSGTLTPKADALHA